MSKPARLHRCDDCDALADQLSISVLQLVFIIFLVFLFFIVCLFLIPQTYGFL